MKSISRIFFSKLWKSGVDAFEDDDDEDKPETKAHYAPSQPYYVLNSNDPQKTASFSSSNSKSSAKQRPNSNIWRPCE